MEYYVTITETVAKDFKVIADSKEEAEQLARKKYYNSEFVLEPGEIVDVNFYISKADDN